MIEAKHLIKSFGHVHAVNDLSLNVDAGQIYGLVGSDGAGKTTALRLLVGALRADAGDVTICGYDVRRHGEQARACIGYLSQRFSLYEDLTVLENIRFFAELRGLIRGEWLPRCMEILDFVGLVNFKDRRAGQLSGGMKQKLGLASALVTRPKVLLLDEPTTGVDPVTRQDFWQLIIRLVASPLSQPEGEPEGGVSILLTTPYMDEASRCHRVGFMRAGKIIAEGTPSELRATLDGRIIEVVPVLARGEVVPVSARGEVVPVSARGEVVPVPARGEVVPVPARGEVRGQSLVELRAAAQKLDGVEDVRLFGDRLHLRVAAAQAGSVIAALADAFPASAGSRFEARPIPPTLEDVFITLSS